MSITVSPWEIESFSITTIQTHIIMLIVCGFCSIGSEGICRPVRVPEPIVFLENYRFSFLYKRKITDDRMYISDR